MKLLDLLNVETGASVETLLRIISTAPKRYKVYQIPKRNGDGVRVIAHPAKPLKAIQRVVLHQLLDRAPVSAIATAYVRGRGITSNARRHAGQPYILKLDFEQFFPSIHPRDWDRFIRASHHLKEYISDNTLLHKILFWGAGRMEPTCLSIGAPTSPSISNLVCLSLDSFLIEQAEHFGLRVTRYADDITVSGSDVQSILQFEKTLSNALQRNKGLTLRLNDKKRGLYGPGQRKMVTGLILTPDGRVSIGRERKREINALVHKFSIGQSNEDMVFRGKGLLAFAKSAEPTFFASMVEKYGISVIRTLQKADSPFDYLLMSSDL